MNENKIKNSVKYSKKNTTCFNGKFWAIENLKFHPQYNHFKFLLIGGKTTQTILVSIDSKFKSERKKFIHSKIARERRNHINLSLSGKIFKLIKTFPIHSPRASKKRLSIFFISFILPLGFPRFPCLTVNFSLRKDVKQFFTKHVQEYLSIYYFFLDSFFLNKAKFYKIFQWK